MSNEGRCQIDQINPKIVMPLNKPNLSVNNGCNKPRQANSSPVATNAFNIANAAPVMNMLVANNSQD